MRVPMLVCGLAMAGGVAPAQAPVGDRVRVLGETMSRQVVSRVDPVYPEAALQKGIGGEVVLYTAVGKDGVVEQVAVVQGPDALQAAAVDAVKQWKFMPWLVNGTPVEVDTTVTVDFEPQAPGGAAPGIRVSDVWERSMSKPTLPTGGKPPNPAGVGAAMDDARNSTGDPLRKVAVAAALPEPMPMTPVIGSKVAGASGIAPAPNVLMVKPPVSSSSSVAGAIAGEGDVSRFPVTADSPNARLGVRSVSAPDAASIADPPTRPNAVMVATGGTTEWHLLKTVPPEYPQAAVDAGIEGVVLVAGIVKTDGRLRDVHIVSGAAELQQAAIDAASQYVYEPVLHGGDLTEAHTQVPVMFTLSGPAKVPAEVMAGRIVDSYTPPYPPDAMQAGISGAVILHVLIGRQGQVKDVQVVSGHEMLRATAVDAVKQWRYLPYKRAGVDVEVETDVEVQFTLLKQ